MATLTAASEIQAKLNAAIAALSPSHRHLYISSLMLVSPILPPGVNSSELPYQVKEALRLYREREAVIHTERQQIEEKQRQSSAAATDTRHWHRPEEFRHRHRNTDSINRRD
jgi:hypothetical protein